MSRDHDELSRRPDRVIIVDADDPMTEVHGRFVWEDEHLRVLDEVRRRAFEEGYQVGLQERRDSVLIRLRRRRSAGYYVRLSVIVLLCLFVILMLPILIG